MCRDELLLKTAVLGLVSLDATQQQMATLLQCYKGEVVLLADAWSLHKSAHSERRCVQPDAARSWDAWHRVGSTTAGVQWHCHPQVVVCPQFPEAEPAAFAATLPLLPAHRSAERCA